MSYYDVIPTTVPANPKYQAILKLDKMLSEHNIPHELWRLCDGWIIIYPSRENGVADVIEHGGSYGSRNDLVEAMGFVECKGDVIGGLSVDDAFKLFEHIKEMGW